MPTEMSARFANRWLSALLTIAALVAVVVVTVPRATAAAPGAPTPPSPVTVTVLDGGAMIEWGPSTDDQPEIRYSVFKNGAWYAYTRFARSYSDSAYTPGDTYQVMAIDSDNNYSEKSVTAAPTAVDERTTVNILSHRTWCEHFFMRTIDGVERPQTGFHIFAEPEGTWTFSKKTFDPEIDDGIWASCDQNMQVDGSGGRVQYVSDGAPENRPDRFGVAFGGYRVDFTVDTDTTLHLDVNTIATTGGRTNIELKRDSAVRIGRLTSLSELDGVVSWDVPPGDYQLVVDAQSRWPQPSDEQPYGDYSAEVDLEFWFTGS